MSILVPQEMDISHTSANVMLNMTFEHIGRVSVLLYHHSFAIYEQRHWDGMSLVYKGNEESLV